MSDTTASFVRRTQGYDRTSPSNKIDDEYRLSLRILFWVALSLTAVLVAGLIMQMLGEAGMTNSYALLADAFLSGRLDITECVDVDCALYDDNIYVVFPPGPAILAMPFVALFGPGFAAFIALTSVITTTALFVWWRVLVRLGVESMTSRWMLIAIAVGTPLYFVTVRGDGVWFMAQATGFLFVTLAIWAALARRSLWLVGAFLAGAFLSRQLTILIAPFVFALYLRDDEPLISFRLRRLFDLSKLAIPILAAIGAYMAYNYARFGAPMDTGYDYIAAGIGGERNFITERIDQAGLFSTDYFLFNLFYLFAQGFHVDFTGPLMTELGSMDRMGTSILAASPFVLLAVFVKWRRPIVIGALCAVAMIVPMLLYHSNGFTQYNVQRYVLDWLPIIIYALALTVRGGLRPAFAVLVTYAVGLNVVTSVVAYMTQA